MGELKLQAVSLDGSERVTLFDNSAYENAWREYEVNAHAQAYNYRVSSLCNFDQSAFEIVEIIRVLNSSSSSSS